MTKYAVPVSWTMTSIVTVEADSPEEAMEIANKTMFSEKFPLPKTGAYYLDDSFAIDNDMIEPADRYSKYALSELTIHKDCTWTDNK